MNKYLCTICMAHIERLREIGKVSKYVFITFLGIACVTRSIRNTHYYTIIETNKCRTHDFGNC